MVIWFEEVLLVVILIGWVGRGVEGLVLGYFFF